jgi:phosphate acyltransferase
VAARQQVEMDESPLEAVRRKRDSSLAIGIQMLRDGEGSAFITLGNTGALVATSALLLPRLPGIERPALLARMPTRQGEVVVLDVGAQVAPSPHQLVQYAQMGVAFCQVVAGIENPTVGLLNIGEEAGKGTAAARQAYQALEAAAPHHKLRFLGNVEGREVFQGKVDLLVTDGFTGNVFLKSSEGVCAFLLEYLLPLAGDALKQELNRFARYVREPSGALLCGVDGLVMKCHGASSPAALVQTLPVAFDWIQRGLISAMKQQLTA